MRNEGSTSPSDEAEVVTAEEPKTTRDQNLEVEDVSTTDEEYVNTVKMHLNVYQKYSFTVKIF